MSMFSIIGFTQKGEEKDMKLPVLLSSLNV